MPKKSACNYLTLERAFQPFLMMKSTPIYVTIMSLIPHSLYPTCEELIHKFMTKNIKALLTEIYQ